MKVTLFDKNPALIDAWKQAFFGVENVEITCCDLLELPNHEAVVTAGNCFGTMTGGIDLEMRALFGYGLQDAVQNYILAQGRPLFIGEALLSTPQNRKPHGHVIYAPTMYCPQPIQNPEEVYRATYAALYCAMANGITEVALPGMGTGVGAIPPDIAARLMRRAYDAVELHA